MVNLYTEDWESLLFGMKSKHWDFPGGLVVKTLHFQCRGHRFDPWWETKIPHVMQKIKRSACRCWEQFRSQVQEDPTDRGAVTPGHHTY